MYRALTILLLVFLQLPSVAQEVHGIIISEKSGRAVSDVLVANKRTGESVYSDSLGAYTIPALEGDLLFFYRLGYNSRRETVQTVKGKMPVMVLASSEITLEEVQVRGNTYKIDSIERSIIYRKAMNDANQKVKVSVGTGIAFNGLIGKTVSRITGREKRLQRFKRTFVQGERDRFINTRYNTEVIYRVTGLTGDDAGKFLNAYPIPYDYARTASELELLMWIRNNYKQYSNKPK
jgi:hypothetical protein